jgi:hypothetical protein
LQSAKLIAGFWKLHVGPNPLLPARDALVQFFHHRAQFVEQIHRDLRGFGFDFLARGPFEPGL